MTTTVKKTKDYNSDYAKQKKLAGIELDKMFRNPVKRDDYVYDSGNGILISTYDVLKDILLITEQSQEYQERYDLKTIRDIDSNWDNTYNYGLPTDNDFEFNLSKGRGEWYVFIRIHNGNDVRCGYSDAKCFKLNIDADESFISYFSLDENDNLIARPY